MSSEGVFSRRDRLRYRVDDALARGEIWWVVLALGGIMASFLLFAAALIGLTGLTDDDGRPLGYVEGFWQALLRALDPGTLASDTAWKLRLVALVVTLAGVLVVSTVIGLVATGIHARLTDLRRGHSPVIESGHTLVLGWSAKAHTIVSELAEAHLVADPCVVVLASRDKGTMDDQVRSWGLGRGMRVVTRSGTPQERGDLRLVHPELARSIIVLRDSSNDSDARVIKTVLALVNDIGLPAGTPVVAEIAARSTAESLRRVVGSQVIVVEPGELIGRVIAQSARHPGLDLVLCDLFDFAGSEIYEWAEPELVHRPFREALTSFERSIPIGINRVERGPVMKPPMDAILEPGDRIILLSEDPSQIRCVGPGDLVAVPRTLASRAQRSIERTVMFGFNEFAPIVITELDDYVAAGSTLTVVVDPDVVSGVPAMIPPGVRNLDVRVNESRLGADAILSILEAEVPDHVVVLCYRDGLSSADADARALITFLEAGRSLAELGFSANVVTEILDSRDLDLVPKEWSHGFIVTERLSSLYITQVSENPALVPIFADLLDAEGSELYFKPVEWYVDPPVTDLFAVLVQAAAARDEIAVGYRCIARDGTTDSIVVNPAMRESVRLEPGDQLIVLAEDEC